MAITRKLLFPSYHLKPEGRFKRFKVPGEQAPQAAIKSLISNYKGKLQMEKNAHLPDSLQKLGAEQVVD